MDACLKPTTLTHFKHTHVGKTLIVCGCGPSLLDLKQPRQFTTIGVNDVGRLFDPTYLLVVNPPRQFTGDRFQYVVQSKARALFTQLDLGPVNAPVVQVQLGCHGGTDTAGDMLPYTQNSPYVAVCLAAYMGAARIGLIGVDFTEHHFFAKTGRHPLSGRLQQIDREYGALAAALRGRGVELLNLSGISRLESLQRCRLEDFTGQQVANKSAVVSAAVSAAFLPTVSATIPAAQSARRVFVVNYRFITCGDVFTDGLRHAAGALNATHAEAYWDDPSLPEKVADFDPDLLLVVHGRRFVQKWGLQRFKAIKTAVWLTDEPYEVDDTAAWSKDFDYVFCNDPNTLGRHTHTNAHYLPMCFDPQVHRAPDTLDRLYQVGFIGGYNTVRERYLLKLAEAGLLSYVVGGPWRALLLRKLCLATNVTARRCAELYQQTRIVINVFRETHQFNAQQVAAHAMNPRIYEALACGAMVVSERRAEVGEVFPELPQFGTADELATTIGGLLHDPGAMEAMRQRCADLLAGHGYQNRLAQVLGMLEPRPLLQAEVPELVPTPVPATVPVKQAPVQRPLPVVHASPEMPPALPAATRRNMLFHIWPVRGNTWRWNVEELKRRMDLFNGRRIVGIVCDERSESADAVQDALAGHGCEFIVGPNDARGEVATFAKMLERVASCDADELTFYAHAKGVKYEPVLPPPVRRWAEVQYAVTLDDWQGLRRQLQQFAMTGIFRRHGRFHNHQNVGDWHYSGTFFWLRHAQVFQRRWAEVPQFYGGVEAWPGVQFRSTETGCMLLDNLRDLPYQERFWRQRGNPAFHQWQTQRKQVPTPADLANPLAFEGYALPRLEHKPAEFEWWLDHLLQRDVKNLLLIGAGWGGEEWHTARRFRDAGRTICITTLITKADRPERLAAADEAARTFGQNLRTLHSSLELAPYFDAVFIDGQHGYRECNADFDAARSLGPQLIGLHDIVDSDWHAQNQCCVSRLWGELKQTYRTEERVGAEWAGIGLVFLS